MTDLQRAEIAVQAARAQVQALEHAGKPWRKRALERLAAAEAAKEELIRLEQLERRRQPVGAAS